MNEHPSIDEARSIMGGGLGEYELELVASFCAPLYWAYRGNREVLSHNGTAFFLNAGQGVFGVTAGHVIDGWHKSKHEEDAGPLRLSSGNGSSLALDWAERVIDIDLAIDIATFHITDAEVTRLGKIALTGYQKTWPPSPPTERRGIYYCGYPGVCTQHPSMHEVIFGTTAGSGIATSVSEKDVSTLIEREYLMPVLADGIPPVDFDFRGISGGPMLSVVQDTLRSWTLAGVIYKGPNVSEDPNKAIAGLEIIAARRAHFILPDGKLDEERWSSVVW